MAGEIDRAQIGARLVEKHLHLARVGDGKLSDRVGDGLQSRMIALQPRGRLQGVRQRRRIGRKAGTAPLADVDGRETRLHLHTLLAGLRQGELDPVAEAEAVADMAFRRRLQDAVRRFGHDIGKHAICCMGLKGRVAVGGPGDERHAEDRLPRLDDIARAGR